MVIKVEKVGCKSETDRAKVIVVHRPNSEFFLGAECPTTSLFEGPLNPDTALSEHNRFTNRLKRKGIEVLELEDIILDGTIDENGQSIEGSELDSLRDLAYDALIYEDDLIDEEEKIKLKSNKFYQIELLSPAELFRIILKRPCKDIYNAERQGELTAYNREYPLSNLMFMRDQIITTDRGIVIGSMKEQSRQYETILVEFLLNKLGSSPILTLDLNGTAKLEGGDFIPAGDIAFIGQGERTNDAGIEKLLTSGALGYKKVFVVRHQGGMYEMHLDTYFNFVGKNKVLLAEDAAKLNVEVYMRKDFGRRDIVDSSYEKLPGVSTFEDVLRDQGYQIGKLDKKLQGLYGINILSLGDDEFIGVDLAAKMKLKDEFERIKRRSDVRRSKRGIVGGHAPFDNLSYEDISDAQKRYTDILEGLGIKNPQSMLLDFNHLNRAYGGPHCLTQVLLREP